VNTILVVRVRERKRYKGIAVGELEQKFRWGASETQLFNDIARTHIIS